MKSKIVKSSLILLFGGIITKLLGMVIKILMGRIVGIAGISLYMLILPTFSLFMSIGQIGLPLSLSRLVAMNDKNNRNLFFSIIPIVFIFNIFLMVLLILLSSFISINLLHNSRLTYGIIAIGLVLPFTSISSICRSYFIGRENMFPPVLSNVCENVVRLLFIVLVLPKLLFLDLNHLVFMIIISNVLSEGIAIIILSLFIPNKKFLPVSFNFNYVKEAFSLSIYNVLGNIISNVSYFLEPIILTNLFIYLGYSLEYVSFNYGIITGYILPLICLPSFFTNAISQAILPSITMDYESGSFYSIKKKIRFVSLILLVFGVLFSSIFVLFGDRLLFILYKNSVGFNYLRILAPTFILYYIHAPYHIVLHAMGKNKDDLFLTIVGSIVRPLCLFIFSLFKIGIYAFLLSIICNLIVSTFLLYRRVSFYLKEK